MRPLKVSTEQLRILARRVDVHVRSATNGLKRALVEENGDTGEVIKVGAAIVLVALLVVFGRQIMAFIEKTWKDISGG